MVLLEVYIAVWAFFRVVTTIIAFFANGDFMDALEEDRSRREYRRMMGKSSLSTRDVVYYIGLAIALIGGAFLIFLGTHFWLGIIVVCTFAGGSLLDIFERFTKRESSFFDDDPELYMVTTILLHVIVLVLMIIFVIG